MDRINLSNDAYKNVPIINIIFSYGIRDGKITPSLGHKKKDIKFHTYYKNKLPLGLVPSDYGKILLKNGNAFTISLDKNTIINLSQELEDNKPINIINYNQKGEILFSWKDKIISNNKFIRYIGKSIIHLDNGQISIFKVQKKTTGIINKILNKNNSVTNKFITMDLETIIINNKLIPYLLC
jgi:hypothetical protein